MIRIGDRVRRLYSKANYSPLHFRKGATFIVTAISKDGFSAADTMGYWHEIRALEKI